VTAVLKPASVRPGYPAWVALCHVWHVCHLCHLTVMPNSDQKQKMIQALRNESKLALGVVLKCAAALLILELLIRVVTTAGLRVDGGPFPLGAAPLPPALAPAKSLPTSLPTSLPPGVPQSR
jgi:hypothetical protein